MSLYAQYTMNGYQADTAATAIYDWKIIYPALGLANESGEVLGKLKKMIRDDNSRLDGPGSMTDEQRHQIASELGDVLWYVAQLASELGYDLEEVATANLNKLASRAARGRIGGSGDQR